jgi:hypothetical protein
MDTVNKRWMIWIIAALALMNLATIFTVLYHRNKASENEIIYTRGPAMSESSSVRFSGRYFRDELGLTREQMYEFSGFNPRFRQEAGRINIMLSEKRLSMLSEMSEENSDTIRLNVLSDSIGLLHAELKKATYIYYLDFKKICTTEQEEKLEQIFGEMFDSDILSGPMGRGRQGGNRMRWRSGN